MEIKIINEKKNPLFKRKEVNATFEGEIIPSYAEITKEISKKMSVPEENIQVRRVKGKFGSKKFNIEINVYDSKEEKEFLELKPKEKKK